VTQPADKTNALAQFRARNLLIQAVRDSLKGRRLDIRERTNNLVVTNPGHPEHGRIYITLPSGEVSWQRTTWEYLGQLDGHHSHDPGDEPPVTADTIIATLGAQPSPPGPS
jgi:hypothetical protein